MEQLYADEMSQIISYAYHDVMAKHAYVNCRHDIAQSVND